MNTVLRLLVLLSVVGGGIKQKTYDSIRRDFLQTYGYNHLPLLLSLSRLSLFNKPPASASSSTKPIFTSLRKSLRLIVDDVDETAPNDISFVYSGYAPMSIRLVQCVAQKAAVLSTPVSVSDGSAAGGGAAVPRAHPIVGWKGFEDVLANIPGATFDDVQTVEGADVATRTNGRECCPASRSSLAATLFAQLSCSISTGLAKDHVATTIVFFLGGCTFTEIAALRKMREGSKGQSGRLII